MIIAKIVLIEGFYVLGIVGFFKLCSCYFEFLTIKILNDFNIF